MSLGGTAGHARCGWKHPRCAETYKGHRFLIDQLQRRYLNGDEQTQHPAGRRPAPATALSNGRPDRCGVKCAAPLARLPAPPGATSSPSTLTFACFPAPGAQPAWCATRCLSTELIDQLLDDRAAAECQGEASPPKARRDSQRPSSAACRFLGELH